MHLCDLLAQGRSRAPLGWGPLCSLSHRPTPRRGQAGRGCFCPRACWSPARELLPWPTRRAAGGCGISAHCRGPPFVSGPLPPNMWFWRWGRRRQLGLEQMVRRALVTPLLPFRKGGSPALRAACRRTGELAGRGDSARRNPTGRHLGLRSAACRAMRWRLYGPSCLVVTLDPCKVKPAGDRVQKLCHGTLVGDRGTETCDLRRGYLTGCSGVVGGSVTGVGTPYGPTTLPCGESQAHTR